MHRLIKYFANQKYAHDFTHGKLYMNSLNYFWNNGFEEQRDTFEGVICTVPANQFPLSPSWQIIQACDYRFRAEGYKYCNVLCFYRVDYIIDGPMVRTAFPQNMNLFGNFVVIINNETEFLRRVKASVKRLNYKFLCGDVHYHVLKKNGVPAKQGEQVFFKSQNTFDVSSFDKRLKSTNRDCFDKCSSYQSQNEWRIALYRGEKTTDAYVLDVGDLSDIVAVFPVGQFEQEFRKNLKQNVLVSRDDCYYGNIGRKELRNLFYQLGENKASMFMTM